MEPLPSEVKLLRFGIFEVDLRSGEVRKAGVKQKLAPVSRLAKKVVLSTIGISNKRTSVLNENSVRRTGWSACEP
jgi:hypothetical protein